MKIITKQGSDKQGDYTYFAEVTQINENEYTIEYKVETDKKYCPVNQQFCDISNCNGCIHYDNGFKLQRITKDEYDKFTEEHKDLN